MNATKKAQLQALDQQAENRTLRAENDRLRLALVSCMVHPHRAEETARDALGPWTPVGEDAAPDFAAIPDGWKRDAAMDDYYAQDAAP